MKDFINPYNDKTKNKIKENLIRDAGLENLRYDYIYYTQDELHILDPKEKQWNSFVDSIYYQYLGQITFCLVINEYEKFYTLAQVRKMLDQALKEIVRDNF